MFITLEGTEGSGKTTQLPLLAAFLRQEGHTVLTTREPGGTNIGNQIREILLSLRHTDMQPRTETLLFQAARAQLVEQVIRPHLEQGGIILCDRYGDSTLAYQGYGQGGDLETLRLLVNFATGSLKPDLTLLLDMDVALGLQRRKDSGGEWNRLDAQALAYYQRVRLGYMEMVRQEPERWTVIDAGQPFDEVQAEMRRVVLQRIAARSHATQP